LFVDASARERYVRPLVDALGLQRAADSNEPAFEGEFQDENYDENYEENYEEEIFETE
ncbi:MAG: hypothetical protein ACI87O_002166, partial [Planctomycetota bacterium]